MATIGRNRKKRIEELRGLLTKCEVKSLDFGFIGQDVPPAAAWKMFDQMRNSRLYEDRRDEKYTIQVHSNLWYVLTK